MCNELLLSFRMPPSSSQLDGFARALVRMAMRAFKGADARITPVRKLKALFLFLWKVRGALTASLQGGSAAELAIPCFGHQAITNPKITANAIVSNKRIDSVKMRGGDLNICGSSTFNETFARQWQKDRLVCIVSSTCSQVGLMVGGVVDQVPRLPRTTTHERRRRCDPAAHARDRPCRGRRPCGKAHAERLALVAVTRRLARRRAAACERGTEFDAFNLFRGSSLTGHYYAIMVMIGCVGMCSPILSGEGASRRTLRFTRHAPHGA